jgi:AraC-like DNA-binding protein
MLNIAEAMMADPLYFKTLTVNDSLLVNYNCPQMQEWADLYTNFNHIIYTISGERRIVRPEKSVDVKKGSLIFSKKSAFQQGKFYNEDWQVIVFCIHDNYFQSIRNEFRSHFMLQAGIEHSKKDILFEIGTNDTIDAYFYSLLPYFTQQSPPNETLINLKLRELIFNILFNEANSGLLSFLNNLMDDRKSSFIDTMESNFMFNLSLAEFAKITHHSLTNFKKEFAEIFTTSPGKWLIQKRLDLACNFLTTSEKTVREIASDIGFESVTHFNRVFKERHGMSPLKYREQRIS